ncbi:AraC family transcriptional regulator [Nocardia farcinica]|uniref:AraC family transcriptional regulator n=1 Tax=Nocardia farcinica TaxID=37329 RepID=UPI001895436A|nr:AraC family transcriptional regulator [Nocardia farcinica]MBF6069788.1 AraC family transcriptional regulator [Nocardia farcinica]MBF6270433.1 AraC family transcriptional regulator [Nocardia farcinica]MBF6418014.1 AraC family transcriptional regulator [Nocardia farcinica]MBF6429491.1 AraC family transcriptional regulator [Nocardia farcinica]MBF6500075.1 AraC family transcriptional regulator [Nocardia farcinica]
MAERERSGDCARTEALVSLRTSELDSREGRTQWSSTLERLYCEMDVAWPDPHRHFDAEWGGRPFGDLHVSTIRADAHTVVRSPAMIGSDEHVGHLVCLVTEGRVEVRQAGRTTVLEDGAFALLDCAAPFVFHSPAPFRQVVVRTPTELLTARLPGRIVEHGTARAIGGDTGAGELVGRFLRDLSTTTAPISPGAALSLASSTVDMLATALADGPVPTGAAQLHRTEDLAYVQRVIEQQLHDPELTLAQVAAEAGMSLRTVQKLFSAAGTTPRTWLYQARLERARKYLVTTQMSVAQVSECAGFRDVSHFSRTFRAAFGTSPGRYRAAHTDAETP